MDFVKAHAWLAILTILTCLKGCVAPPGDCGYVASTLVYPLGQLIGTTEIKQVVPGSAISTTIAPAHPSLDYDAMWFSGPASSANLPMDDPVAFPGGTFPEDYGFQFVFYPEADGNVLRYETDTPTNAVDICTVVVSLNGGFLSVTLESQTNTDTLVVDHVITYNTQWHWVSVGRDGSRNVVFARVDGTEYQLDFAAWTDGGVTTMTPGHFTVGAGFTGRLTCFHVIVCKSPEHVADYFTECNTPNWPASLPNTTSTSPDPTTSSTTTTLTPTTVTTTTPSTTTTSPSTTTTSPSTTTTTPSTTTTTTPSTTTTVASTTPPTSAVPLGMKPAIPPVYVTECVAP